MIAITPLVIASALAVSLGSVAEAQVSRQSTSVEPLDHCEGGIITLSSHIYQLPHRMTDDKPDNDDPEHSRLVRGLAVQPTGYTIEITMQAIPMRGSDRFCAGIDEVRVSAGVDPPVVWIDPEVTDPCLRDAIKAHELEHVEHFHDYLDDFERALSDIPDRFRPENRNLAREDELDHVLETLGQRLQDHVESVHATALSRMVRRDTSIDTPEEYRRVRQTCD